MHENILNIIQISDVLPKFSICQTWFYQQRYLKYKISRNKIPKMLIISVVMPYAYVLVDLFSKALFHISKPLILKKNRDWTT